MSNHLIPEPIIRSTSAGPYRDDGGITVRVLVTVTRAYLGCPGAPALFEDSHDVVGDGGFFWKGELQ
jgi:hypothetical protein